PLSARAWGRGIATEAAARVLDYGFRVFELDSIVGVAHLENRASHQVLRKIGLERQADGFHYGQSVAVFSLSRVDYMAESGAREGDRV
ncbi:MAG: GNAT family N-acetyltransferase, partial [Kiloniellales bacterium]|nr:GNAT family N-acetyltransferase [Kiloniellales bacterium]